MFFHLLKKNNSPISEILPRKKNTGSVCVCARSAYRLGIHADRFYLQKYSQTTILAVFWGPFLCCSQIGDDPQEDLARLGNKLNMKIKFSNIVLSFSVTLL
jgi:hypothetical protein